MGAKSKLSVLIGQILHTVRYRYRIFFFKVLVKPLSFIVDPDPKQMNA